MNHWHTDDLQQLKAKIWGALCDGVDDEGSPFHTPALATCDKGICKVRTVVLRAVTPAARSLSFYTDIRSPKIAQISENSFVSWLFYDVGQQVQIRVEGEAIIHQGTDAARQAWQQIPLSSRLNYLTEFAPGTVIEKPSSGLPETLFEGNLTAEALESGWQNFALIETTISRFDWLYLTDRGHRRAEFVWTGKDFAGHWLTP